MNGIIFQEAEIEEPFGRTDTHYYALIYGKPEKFDLKVTCPFCGFQGQPESCDMAKNITGKFEEWKRLTCPECNKGVVCKSDVKTVIRPEKEDFSREN